MMGQCFLVAVLAYELEHASYKAEPQLQVEIGIQGKNAAPAVVYARDDVSSIYQPCGEGGGKTVLYILTEQKSVSISGGGGSGWGHATFGPFNEVVVPGWMYSRSITDKWFGEWELCP